MYQRTIEELQKDEREKVIIDIRREADFLRETYPGAKHIYWEEFEAHRDEVPKDRPVYLICYTGERSDELARELLEEGYEVYSVQGGYAVLSKSSARRSGGSSQRRSTNTS